MIFTFAPSNPLLMTMFALGRLFPRGDRSPSIWPVTLATLTRLIAAEPALRGWRVGRTGRVTRGFYISQALELVREEVTAGGVASALPLAGRA
jgi:magnesium-protoporphyrin O-methyltransferase